jgi:hypothetical protein
MPGIGSAPIFCTKKWEADGYNATTSLMINRIIVAVRRIADWGPRKATGGDVLESNASLQMTMACEQRAIERYVHGRMHRYEVRDMSEDARDENAGFQCCIRGSVRPQ